jgi:hypothetical protein
MFETYFVFVSSYLYPAIAFHAATMANVPGHWTDKFGILIGETLQWGITSERLGEQLPSGRGVMDNYVPRDNSMKEIYPTYNYEKYYLLDPGGLKLILDQFEPKEGFTIGASDGGGLQLLGHQEKISICVLEDSNFGRPLKAFKPYSRLIETLMQGLRKVCIANAITREHAIASGRKIVQKIPVPEDLVAPSLLRAAEIHYNRTETDTIKFFWWHTDKAGDIVTFFPLIGESWNFVVCPSPPRQAQDHEDPNSCIFHQSCGDFREYKTWKESLDDDEKRLVKGFEDAMPIKGEKSCVVVFKMVPGKTLTFPARNLCHATIVPKKQTRCLVILFDLDYKAYCEGSEGIEASLDRGERLLRRAQLKRQSGPSETAARLSKKRRSGPSELAATDDTITTELGVKQKPAPKKPCSTLQANTVQCDASGVVTKATTSSKKPKASK